jgi:hypothetical protein
MPNKTQGLPLQWIQEVIFGYQIHLSLKGSFYLIDDRPRFPVWEDGQFEAIRG